MALKVVQAKSVRAMGTGQVRTKFRKVLSNYELYLFVLPALLVIVIFHYIPMYGIQIAFKDFIATKGITGSPWAGFKHFERFFSSYDCSFSHTYYPGFTSQ